MDLEATMTSDNFPSLAGTPNNEQSFYWYLELQQTLPFKFVSSRFSFFAGQLEPVGWSSQQSKALEIEMTCLKKQNIKGSMLKPDLKEHNILLKLSGVTAMLCYYY